MTRPWWETHPRRYWTAADWAEARRLGVITPAKAAPELPSLDPTERLLTQAAAAGPKLAWGPPPSAADARRREADRLLEAKGIRPRRW